MPQSPSPEYKNHIKDSGIIKKPILGWQGASEGLPRGSHIRYTGLGVAGASRRPGEGLFAQ